MTLDDGIIYPCSAVSINGKGILVTGASGAGKSELCLMLMDRGAELISDDQTLLKCISGELFAYPAPNIAGRIEVRNLGIIEVSSISHIPVALIVSLEEQAPRFIDRPEQDMIAECKIPRIKLDSHSAALPIKAEWALRAYGL